MNTDTRSHMRTSEKILDKVFRVVDPVAPYAAVTIMLFMLAWWGRETFITGTLTGFAAGGVLCFLLSLLAASIKNLKNHRTHQKAHHENDST